MINFLECPKAYFPPPPNAEYTYIPDVENESAVEHHAVATLTTCNEGYELVHMEGQFQECDAHEQSCLQRLEVVKSNEIFCHLGTWVGRQPATLGFGCLSTGNLNANL